MKIVIDLQSCQTPSSKRGIGRYSLDLALEMISIGSEKHDFHILLNSSFSEQIIYLRSVFEPILGKSNIHVFGGMRDISGISDNVHLMESAKIIRELAIRKIQPDFIHVSSFFEGLDNDSVTSVTQNVPTAVTLYDLIPFINQNDYLETPLIRDWYFKKIDDIKNADLFLAISESAGSEVVNHLSISTDRVVNISSSISKQFEGNNYNKSALNNLHKECSIQGKYILYTANLDKRKNVHNLFEAYANLSEDIKQEHKLVIVSYIDEIRELEWRKAANNAGINESQLVLTGHVSDDTLIELYANCSLFVFPSLHEGFGLPCLEAMSCGAPVIASNTTSLPEVIGLPQAMFDPMNTKEISEKIELSLTDDSFMKMLLENSGRQKKKFSWKNTAEKALSAMEKYKSDLDREIAITEKPYDWCMSEFSRISQTLSDDELREVVSNVDITLGNDKPALLVDITALAEHDAKTGIQRVVKSVIENWCTIQMSHEMRLIYLASDGHYYYATEYESKYPEFKDDRTKGYVSPSSGDIFIGLDLVAHCAHITGSIYSKWRQLGVNICIVVYDILPVRMPEYFHTGITDAFPPWCKMISKQADNLICISESVAEDINDYIIENEIDRGLPQHIDFFHLGADFSTHNKINNKPLEISDIDLSNTFLMVGTVEPRKGHEQVISAFELLRNENPDLNLVIVGKPGWNTEKLTKKLDQLNKEQSNIRWLKQCSDETLTYLYHHSSALISGSYGEGFGLPLIESAAYELPVIARDIPVFREVAGNGAFYFDAKTSLELKEQLLEWLYLKSTKKLPEIKEIKHMSWKQSSLMLLECIERKDELFNYQSNV